MPEKAQSRIEEIVDLLQRHGVEFIVIGGQAEYLFGSPRLTYDTDLCFKRSKENLLKLAAALRELKPVLRDFPPDLPFTIDEHALALGTNFTFSTPLGDLDLLSWVEPIGNFDDLLRHAETHQIGDRSVRTVLTISLDDLIRVKQYIRRPKDQESLFQLLAIKKGREDTGKK